MREPRMFKMPNGSVINVDVTSLHIGLSRCGSIAEDALTRLEEGNEVDVTKLCIEILEEVRKTLHEVADEEMADEVAAVLRDEEK